MIAPTTYCAPVSPRVSRLTIRPERIERAKTLLSQGFSHRRVAVATGISRGTIRKVARGERPDCPPREPAADTPPDTLMPGERRLAIKRRCSVCGGLLEIVPCRRCKIMRLLKTAGLQVYSGDGPDDPLHLELKPDDYRAYLGVHAKRVIAERAAGNVAERLRGQ